MTWRHTGRSFHDYQSAPAAVQKAFDKQARLLSENLRHPSLRAKKYGRPVDLWQARVNAAWRFYFTMEDNSYTIVAIIPHPK